MACKNTLQSIQAKALQ